MESAFDGRSRIRQVAFFLCVAAELSVAIIAVAERRIAATILASILILATVYLVALLRSDEKRVKFLFILPAVVVLACVSVLPILYAIRASFANVSPANLLGHWRFVGLRNYSMLFHNPVFGGAVAITLEYEIIAVGIQLLLGLGFALLLDKLPNYMLSIFLVPMIVTPIVAGLIWKSMLNLDTGFLNTVLKDFGVTGVPWLTYQPLPVFRIFGPAGLAFAVKMHMTYGFLAIVTVDVWQWTPFMTLFILTGLRSLSPEIFEATRVDGSSMWQTFWLITLPMLRSVIVVAVVMRSIEALKAYDAIYAMFGSAVGVRTVNVDLVSHIFRTYTYGTGCALAVLVMLFLTIVFPIFFTMMNRMSEG